MKDTSHTYSMTIKRTGKVLLIYTGGTIGMGKNEATGALEPLDFNHLVRNLPEFSLLETDIDTYQFREPLDSSDITPREWAQIVKIIVGHYDSYDGFVVIHGTDTMAYTASALSFMLENLTKPVVLTGSQLPIGKLRTDGKENLITSIELAAAHYDNGRPMVPEVCIYFSGRLLRGNRSTKRNADGFNAFDSFNYPHLCEAGVTFNFNTHNILQPDYSRPVVPHLLLNPNVVVLSLFPGLQPQLIRHVLDTPALHSIVMRTFGSGNAPHAPWLLELLGEACRRGVVVVNISQCAKGRVEMSRYDAGLRLSEAGVVSGYDSTVEAAVAKLMHLHARCADADEVRRLMNRSLAGEITPEAVGGA